MTLQIESRILKYIRERYKGSLIAKSNLYQITFGREVETLIVYIHT